MKRKPPARKIPDSPSDSPRHERGEGPVERRREYGPAKAGRRR
jgi:hypothetical protein